MPTKVAIVNIANYQPHNLEQGLTAALNIIGGWEKYIKPHDRVLIKPNLLEAVSPAKAATTHPEVVRAVIRAVKACDALPCVGDSPAVHSTHTAAAKAGILAVCREENIPLLSFNTSAEYAYPNGIMVKHFTLAADLQQFDKIISLAKMKTHTFMGVTGAVKNLFGCFVGTDKAQFHLRMQNHADFAAMLVDLYGVVKPVLNIVDGIIGMEGTGPRNGEPINSSLLIAGSNGFAVDLIMAEHMGFAPEQLPVAAAAIKAGISPRLQEITADGSGKAIYHKFKQPPNHTSLQQLWIPNWLLNMAQKQLTAVPTINNKCIGCGRCAKHCPPHIISIVNKTAQIDRHKCIRCYCCQELCPVNAVILQDGKLLQIGKWLQKKFRRR